MRLFILGLFFSSIISFQHSIAQVKLHGYVIEVTTGKPIVDAVVFVNDEFNITKDQSLRDTTDINGFYEISVDTGKYHFGIYAPYQIENDTFMLVYQPGIFSIPDTSLSFFNEHGFNVNYGLSKVHFERLYYLKYNEESLQIHKTEVVNKIFGPAIELTTSIITTNAEPYYQNKPFAFVERKTW